MTGTNNFAKKIFSSTIWDSKKFSLFSQFRACRISVKNSIFQKLPYFGETLPKMTGTNNFAKKYFLALFEMVLNFHYFCKVRACRISVKNSIFQKLSKIVENNFSRWQEQKILPKIFSLALFEIVKNFHYFCKVRACGISVKNSIFQKLPKIVEKHFSRWVEQIILPKNIF